jgi:ribosomal protein S18 acetylase RimI-like enzyme
VAETVTIRAATDADRPALCQLAVELVRQHVGYDPARYQPPADVAAAYAELLAHHLGRPESVVLVADAGGRVVGYVFGAVEAPSLVALAGRAGWVHDLYVAPTARGRGAGGRLLDAAVAALHRIGCPGGVLLGVAAQNVAAAALFRGRGFRPTLQEMALGPRSTEDAASGAAPGRGGHDR